MSENDAVVETRQQSAVADALNYLDVFMKVHGRKSFSRADLPAPSTGAAEDEADNLNYIALHFDAFRKIDGKDAGNGILGIGEGNSKNITRDDVHKLRKRVEAWQADALSDEQVTLLAKFGDEISRSELEKEREKYGHDSREYALYDDVLNRYDKLKDQDKSDYMFLLPSRVGKVTVMTPHYSNASHLTKDDISKSKEAAAKLAKWDT